MSIVASKENHGMVEFNEEKMQLLKNTIAKGCTDSEVELFVHACKRLGLDPFMKQIYAVKRGAVMTIQTGIDGFRLIADRSGKYMPGKETTFAYDKDGRLFSATSYVNKLGPDGKWYEIGYTAIYSEYVSKTPIWDKMPHAMLAKCAESACLRKAFPAEMSGIYTDEEMTQADKYPLITPQEAQVLEDLIGSDVDYKTRILDFYSKVYKEKVYSFEKLRREDYEIVLSRAQTYVDKKTELPSIEVQDD